MFSTWGFIYLSRLFPPRETHSNFSSSLSCSSNIARIFREAIETFSDLFCCWQFCFSQTPSCQQGTALLLPCKLVFRVMQILKKRLGLLMSFVSIPSADRLLHCLSISNYDNAPFLCLEKNAFCSSSATLSIQKRHHFKGR